MNRLHNNWNKYDERRYEVAKAAEADVIQEESKPPAKKGLGTLKEKFSTWKGKSK